jgi:hypothetical protein
MAQTNNFNTLTNDILLRINTYETDPTTKNFLKKYVPFLVDKPTETDGWSAYPPIENCIPTYTVGHSIYFLKHPYIDFGTTECRLDFLTNEKNNIISGFQTFFITFLFNSKQEAMNSFKIFCNTYDQLSSSKNIKTKADKQIAFYANMDVESLFQRVEFILTQDDLYDNKYKIIFGQILDLQFEDYYKSQH